MAFEGAQIRSTLDGATPVDGARDDLAQAQVVGLSLVNLPQAPVSYEWLLLGRPEYSEAGGAGSSPWPLGTGPTASFTVDNDSGAVHLDGTYIVQCTLNKDSPLESRFSVMLARNTPYTIPGFEDARTLRKLGMFESFEDTLSVFGVLAGWSTMMNRWLEALAGVLAGGGGGGGSLLTTKGDLLTHNSTVDVRLGVGNPGDVLTVDPAAADGIKWAPPAASPGGASVATWTGAMFFAVDEDNGDDTRTGSGTTGAAAVANAVRTHARLAQVIPVVGAGRIIVILGVARAAGAAFSQDLNLTNAGISGYSLMVIRGTHAGTNDAAERIECGAVQASVGPNGDGSWSVGTGTDTYNWTTTGTFPAADTMRGYRYRWTPSTPSAALPNKCGRLYTHGAGAGATLTSCTQQSAGTVPAGGGTPDTFFIEKPGYAMPKFDVRGCALEMYVAGVRTTSTNRSAFQANSRRFCGVAFVDAPGITVLDCEEWGCGTSFVAEDGAGVAVGSALRVASSYIFLYVKNLYLDQVDLLTPGSGIIGCPIAVIGDTASIFKWMPKIIGCGIGLGAETGGASTSPFPVATFGNVGDNQVTNKKTLVLNAVTTSGIFNGNMAVIGVDATGLGTFGIKFGGVGCNFSVDNVVGTTGNTGVGLDFQDCYGCEIVLEKGSANAITGTLGDIRLPGQTSITSVSAGHADFRKVNIGGDMRGNRIQGTGMVSTGKCHVFGCNEVSGIQVGKAFYTEGNLFNCKLAKADAVPTARVEGFAVTAGVVDNQFYGTTNGVAYVNLDAAGSGSVLYLSAANAGNLTFTPPGGGAQVVQIARALDSDGVLTSVHAVITAQSTGGGSVSPLTTKGDIYTHDATVDARLPVGTNGQLLSADSTQATGLKWVPAPTGTSPLTTKGDIFGFTTLDARVPVGSDGQVLTADSGQAAGVKWATPAGGSSGGAILNWLDTDEVGTDGAEFVVARADVDFTSFPGPNITFDLSAWARHLSAGGITVNSTVRVRISSSSPNIPDGTVVIGPITIASALSYARVNGSATVALPAGRKLVQLTVTGGTDGSGPFFGFATAASVQLT